MICDNFSLVFDCLAIFNYGCVKFQSYLFLSVGSEVEIVTALTRWRCVQARRQGSTWGHLSDTTSQLNLNFNLLGDLSYLVRWTRFKCFKGGVAVFEVNLISNPNILNVTTTDILINISKCSRYRGSGNILI